MQKKGILMIISGPGGAGKGAICDEITKKRDDIFLAISATSRKPRKHEIDGVNYYFRTEEQFKKMIDEKELLEWINFCGNYYGTPKLQIQEKLDQGTNVILEIEVEGALNVKQIFPQSVLIFVMPPSFHALIDRFHLRNTEDNLIKQRIMKSLEEVQRIDNYDYLVINDILEEAVTRVEAIISAEHNKPHKHKNLIEEYVNNVKEAINNDN